MKINKNQLSKIKTIFKVLGALIALLYIAGLRHALTTSIQCSLNAKVKLINKPYSQAPKSKVAGVRWWDKLLNYWSSPVRRARNILHMCHCSHKKYIYREGITRKCMGFVKIRIYLPQLEKLWCSLLKDAWIHYVWSTCSTLEKIWRLSDILTTKRTHRFGSWWATSGYFSQWH